MKLYHLAAFFAAALAVYQIVIYDLESEMRSTEGIRSRLVELHYAPALADVRKGE